jgi:RNA-binding protein
MPLPLSTKERKALRARGHKLSSVVNVGKDAITDGVLGALSDALDTHELVKVKLQQACPLDKDDAATALATGTDSTLVARIGRTALLFRPAPDPPAETQGPGPSRS